MACDVEFADVFERLHVTDLLRFGETDRDWSASSAKKKVLNSGTTALASFVRSCMGTCGEA